MTIDEFKSLKGIIEEINSLDYEEPDEEIYYE